MRRIWNEHRTTSTPLGLQVLLTLLNDVAAAASDVAADATTASCLSGVWVVSVAQVVSNVFLG